MYYKCRTYARGAVASVTTGLRVIATISTVTALLLNFLVCFLIVEEGVGLKRQHGKYENLRDLHVELVEARNMCSSLFEMCFQV